jgi:hypothetical protein
MTSLPAARPADRPVPTATSGREVGIKQAADQDLAFGDGLDP